MLYIIQYRIKFVNTKRKQNEQKPLIKHQFSLVFLRFYYKKLFFINYPAATALHAFISRKRTSIFHVGQSTIPLSGSPERC